MSDSDSKSSNGSILSTSFVLFILNIIIIKSATYDQFLVLGLGERWKFHEYMMWAAVGLFIATLVIIWFGTVSVVSENETCFNITGVISTLALIGLFTVFILQYVWMGEMWHKDPEHTIFFYNKFWSDGITNMEAYNQDTAISPVNVTRALTSGVAAVAYNNLRGYDNLKGYNNETTTINPTRSANNLILAIRRRLTNNLVGVKYISRRLGDKVVLASKWVYVMSDVVIRIYGFLLMFLPFIIGVLGCCFGSSVLCAKCMGSGKSYRS